MCVCVCDSVTQLLCSFMYRYGYLCYLKGGGCFNIKYYYITVLAGCHIVWHDDSSNVACNVLIKCSLPQRQWIPRRLEMGVGIGIANVLNTYSISSEADGNGCLLKM